MPSTPSGYVLPPVYLAVPGTTIRAEQHNAPLEDLAQGVNDSVARDGTRPMTANLPMAGRRVTGMAAATADSDAVTLAQMNTAVGGASTAANNVNTRVNNLINALNTELNRAVPVGRIEWHHGPYESIPPGWVPVSGDLVARAAYPDLFAYAQQQSPIAETTWWGSPYQRAKYSNGNGSSNFRLPDLNGVQSGSIRGLYLRGDGFFGLNTLQGDAMRNLTGRFSHAAWDKFADGVFRQEATDFGPGSTAPNNQASVTFDASRQVPIANEFRPVSAVGIWIVRASRFNF